MANLITYDSQLNPLRMDRSAIIRQQVGMKGVARLLSKTYDAGGDAAAAFYNGEEFGVEIGNQIPITYGEVLFKGQILDLGQLRSDFDIEKILKVYRFSTGENGVKGIKGVAGIPGVPGHKFENILVNCKPVQDADTGESKQGGVSLKEIGVPLAVGGAMMLAPTIAKLFNKDPLTGETPEGLVETGIAASSVVTGTSYEGQHLVIGPDGTIIAKSLATSMLETVDFAGTKACKVTVEVTDPEPVDPETEGQMMALMSTASDSVMLMAAEEAAMNCGSEVVTTGTSSAPPPEQPYGGLPLLKHTGSNKYYAQPFNLAETGSVQIHLYYAGLYTTTTTSSTTGQANTTSTCKGSGSVKIKWCVIDSSGKKLDEGDLEKSGVSGYNFTANFSISMDTARSNSCDAFSGPSGTATLRLYRDDAGTSSTDCYFQGFTPVPFVGAAETRDVTWPTDCPEPTSKIADDNLEPHHVPSGSFGTEKCPDPPPGEGEECCPCCKDDDPTDPTDPVDPQPIGCLPVIFKIADKEGTGSGGTDPDDDEAPKLAVNGPRDKTFDPTANTVQFPPLVASYGEGATNTSGTLTVEVKITQGTGSVGASATAAPASFAWDAGSKTATITGPLAQLNTVIGGLVYTPSENDRSADIQYTANIKDNATNKTGGVGGVLKMLNNRVARPARSGTTNVTLSGNSGSVLIRVGGDAISGAVPYATSLEQTAKNLVANINSTRTTPDFTAEWVSGSTLRLIAPAALGDRGNGRAVSADTTGTLSIGTPAALDGGVTKTEQYRSFASKAWSVAKEVLPVAGAGLIAGALWKSISQMQIEVPEDAIDEEGNIAVVLQGMMVRVPNNYNAETRVYTGEWDGETFAAEPVYTTNVAWCLLDFITNKRYGCGNALRMNDRQWKRLYMDIYEAAKRCDEMIGDGRGEQGPRYTLNTVLANMTRLQALESIASAMHAQPVFTAYGLRIIQDRPSVPKMIVTDANAFAKGFTYSGGTMNASYNNVEVSWNNPAEYWRLRATEVMDGLDIVTNGERRNAVVAFGCTSEAQAIRHGAWILTTEKSNPLIVSYSAGFDHAGLIPGDLVILSDNLIEAVDETGQMGGRAAGATTLDREAPVDGSTTIWWIDEDGVLQNTETTVSANSVTGVNLRPNQVFVTTAEADAANNLWKILSITEHSDGEFAVTAVKHDPNKYTDIDGFAA